jgi:phosphoribosylformimino-5-aminoimidazole carboxamide ribotide isomerase
MKLFPAIDLYEGQAVRLLRGDYARKTVYSDDPLSVAKGFAAAGAEYLHMVDLEGARDGGTPNFGTVAACAKESGLKVEIGGGIRDEDTVRRYLDAGVFRVILGTAAVEDRDFLERMAAQCGGQLAVGVDIKDGFVATRGWLTLSDRTAEDFCAYLQGIGVGTVIVTDVSRDGAMRGANRELYRDLTRKTGMDIVASGGVSTLEDVAALRDLGLAGAILGKALYTGAIDLKAAIEVCK